MFKDFRDAFGDKDFDMVNPSIPVASAVTKTIPSESSRVASALPPLSPEPHIPRVIGTSYHSEDEDEDDSDVQVMPKGRRDSTSKLPAPIPKKKRSGFAALALTVSVPHPKRQKQRKDKATNKEVAGDTEEVNELSPHLEGTLTTMNEHVPEAVWGEISETPTVAVFNNLISSFSTVTIPIAFLPY